MKKMEAAELKVVVLEENDVIVTSQGGTCYKVCTGYQGSPYTEINTCETFTRCEAWDGTNQV